MRAQAKLSQKQQVTTKPCSLLVTILHMILSKLLFRNLKFCAVVVQNVSIIEVQLAISSLIELGCTERS